MKKYPCSHSNSRQFRRKPLITFLEPRILLDGAAVASGAAMMTDVAHQQDSVSATPPDNNSPSAELAPSSDKTEGQRREIAFVDTRIDDFQSIVNGISQDIEIYLIENADNGLQPILVQLEGETGIDAIHIFSHGREGELQLGNSIINSHNIEDYEQQLGALGSSLTSNGDILLYGCSVGDNPAGESFINRFAELTRADVAASDDNTGADSQAGDWQLEVHNGVIENSAQAIAGYQGTLILPSLGGDKIDTTFVEHGNPVPIDAGITVSQEVHEYDDGVIDVSVETGYEDGFDSLQVSALNNITVTGSAIEHLGTEIGSLDPANDGTEGKLRIQLVKDATSEQIQALIRAITFSNSSDNPSTSTRTISIELRDNTNSTDKQVDIAVQLNEAPVALDTNADEKWGLGQVFTRDISVLFKDADSIANEEELSYEIKGLPKGLEYSEATGIISGIPAETGEFVVTVTATDKANASATRSFLLEILAPPKEEVSQAPEIINELPAPKVDSLPVDNKLSDLPEGLVNKVFASDPTDGIGFISSEGVVEFEEEQSEIEVETDENGESKSDSDSASIPGEKILFEQDSTQVVQITSSDGSQSFRASVDVNVNPAGEVVYTEADKRAFEAVAMSISGVEVQTGNTIIFIEDSEADSVQEYVGTMADGSALPDWIEVNPQTGSINMTPPPGMDDLRIRIQAIGTGGEIRTLELQLDMEELQQQNQTDTSADKSYIPLNEQLAIPDTVKVQAENLVAQLKSL